MTTNEPSWMNWLSKHSVYLVPSFAAYFIALWALVGFVIGQISGWLFYPAGFATGRRFIRISGGFKAHE